MDNFRRTYATIFTAMHIKDYYWHKPITNKKEKGIIEKLITFIKKLLGHR